MTLNSKIKIFAETPTPLWQKICKEVSWAYRKNRTHAPTLAFVLGRGTGLLPTREAWDMTRKEVNKLRRNARARTKYYKSSLARKRLNEYMRKYMARKRRDEQCS